MIRPDGPATLIDFGIARPAAAARGTTIGTPGYAPPEQYQGLAGPRSDQFALAATVHHLLTGRDPKTHAPFQFPSVRSLVPGLSPTVDAALARALSMNSSDRYANMRTFISALSPATLRVQSLPAPSPRAPLPVKAVPARAKRSPGLSTRNMMAAATSSTPSQPAVKASARHAPGSAPPSANEGIARHGGDREKAVAVLLAVLFGSMGVHRFYVRQPRRGLVILSTWIIMIVMLLAGVNGDVAGIGLDIVVLWSLVDAVRFASMSQESFVRISARHADAQDLLFGSGMHWHRFGKYRVVAVLLALCLPGLGLHRFYLGQKDDGETFLGLWIIAIVLMWCNLGIGILFPLGAIVWSWVDAVRYLTMSRAPFVALHGRATPARSSGTPASKGSRGLNQKAVPHSRSLPGPSRSSFACSSAGTVMLCRLARQSIRTDIAQE